MQERGLELEEADFCINIPGICVERRGWGHPVYSVECLVQRGFGATLQILFLDYQSTHLNLRGPEVTLGFLLHCLGLFSLYPVFVGLTDRGTPEQFTNPHHQGLRDPAQVP